MVGLEELMIFSSLNDSVILCIVFSSNPNHINENIATAVFVTTPLCIPVMQWRGSQKSCFTTRIVFQLSGFLVFSFAIAIQQQE